MKLVERVKYYYLEKDYNCAETLLAAANDVYDLKVTQDDIRMAGGFGGGMFVGMTCGAIVGSVMAIAKKYNKTVAHQNPEVKINVTKLMINFKKEYQSFNCYEIKQKYYNSETKCLNTVVMAADVLQQTIDEIQHDKKDNA